MGFTPSYIDLYKSGVLENIAGELEKRVSNCTLCPHSCGVDRRSDKNGRCKSRVFPIVSAWNPHFGEEAPLVGRRGSGTIFFTNCNLSCVFCQNYDISQLGYGKEIGFRKLAEIMIALQKRGCHNINFVTPTHMIYAIVKALTLAVPMGLDIPLVYNSGGYDLAETLELMEGIFDIYMPDFKYSNHHTGHRLSGARDYPSYALKAVREMHRQAGDLKMDSNGIAYRGVLVRHLVLPGNLAGSYKVVEWLTEISKNIYVNIMDQYRPQYEAWDYPELKSRVSYSEFHKVVDYAKKLGITRLDRE
ncbi:MAG: radical SAM protein [Spirochaetota bacterium]